MPHLVSARVLSAQELLKLQYRWTLRWSAVGALVVLILAVITMPEYRPTPYRLSGDATRVLEIELEAAVVPPPDVRTERIRVPNVVPAPPTESGVVEEIDWPSQLIDIPLRSLRPAIPVDDTPFVATSAKPALLQGAVAEYPEIARLAGLQGTVVVKVLIAPDGTVARVALLKGVHPLLDRPALAAARTLVFRAGTQRGVPVKCWVAVPFRFGLD